MFDLRDHAPRAVPGSGLVVEAAVADQWRVTRTAAWPGEQVLDLPLQHIILAGSRIASRALRRSSAL
jgi:hypothetical protein